MEDFYEKERFYRIADKNKLQTNEWNEEIKRIYEENSKKRGYPGSLSIFEIRHDPGHKDVTTCLLCGSKKYLKYLQIWMRDYMYTFWAGTYCDRCLKKLCDTIIKDLEEYD